MKKKLYMLFFLLYPVVDLITVVFASMFSYEFYRMMGIGRQVFYQKADVLYVSLIFALMTIVILQLFGAYKRKSSLLNMEEIKNVIKGISLSYLLFGMVLVFGRISISRYVLFFSYIFSTMLVVSERMFFYHISPFTKYLKGFHKKVLIYGAGELGTALCREISNSPKLNITPVGFIDDDPAKRDFVCYRNGLSTSECSKVVGNREDIERIRKEHNIDEIYVAISNISNEKIIEIINYIKSKDIKISFIPNLYKVFLQNVRIDMIGEIPLVVEERDFKFLYLYFKRYLDLLLSITILAILSPLFLIIVLAIRLDSRGPAIFFQDRVGKNGEIFRLYKFRSMDKDAKPYEVNPIDISDPRVTRVGRFLRKISLDELPQIINVIKGNMSLVGPRPEMPFIVEKYNEIQRERLKVTPGITGLWQLSGDRKKAIHENLDYDLYYIRNVSFFLDLAILIETVFFAFRGI